MNRGAKAFNSLAQAIRVMVRKGTFGLWVAPEKEFEYGNSVSNAQLRNQVNRSGSRAEHSSRTEFAIAVFLAGSLLNVFVKYAASMSLFSSSVCFLSNAP